MNFSSAYNVSSIKAQGTIEQQRQEKNEFGVQFKRTVETKTNAHTNCTNWKRQKVLKCTYYTHKYTQCILIHEEEHGREPEA